MSTRRTSARTSNRQANPASTAVVTPPNPATWFTNVDLMSPDDFDKIKGNATRDQLLHKMQLLGFDALLLRGNAATLRLRLREHLSHQATVTPRPQGPKRSASALGQASNAGKPKRKKVGFVPPASQTSSTQSGAGDSPSPSSPSSVEVLSTNDDDPPILETKELKAGVSSAFQRMGNLFLRPDILSGKMATDHTLRDLHSGFQWMEPRSLVPGLICSVAALCFIRSRRQQPLIYVPFESLKTDGHALFRINEVQCGQFGSGSPATFLVVEFYKWEEGSDPFSRTDNLFKDSMHPGNKFDVWDETGQLKYLVTSEYVNQPIIRNSDSSVSSTYPTGTYGTVIAPSFGQLHNFSTPNSEKLGGMKTLTYDFDGKLLKYFNKIPDLAGKMKECRIILRMTETSVFTAINQGKGELDIALDDAFNVLVSSGNAWNGPVLDGEPSTGNSGLILINTKRYNLLRRIPGLMHIDVFKTLLTMGWARSKEGLMSYHNTVSLQIFSSDISSFRSATIRKDVFVGAKTSLVEVLKTLEHYFVFIFGSLYDNLCEDLINSLQFGEWADHKWDMGYCRYSIEMILFVTFNEIRDIPRATYMAKSQSPFDISTALGIVSIIKNRFKNLKPSIERVTEFQRIFSDFSSRNTLFGNGETADSVPLTPYTTPSVGGMKRQGQLHNTQWCVYDVYNQAGLINPKTEEIFKCNSGSSCTFRHGDFSTLSNKEQQQLINKWTLPTAKGFPRTPPTMAKSLLSALDKLRNSKTNMQKKQAKHNNN